MIRFLLLRQQRIFDDTLDYEPSLTVGNENFGLNAATGETVSMGSDTVIYNVAWDTVRVQDPYQSWFLVYVNANNGELWGTRNALRLAVTNPQWVCVARNIGGGTFNSVDVEFSKDLNHCYISSGNGIWRVDGLGSVYTSDPNFVSKVAMSLQVVQRRIQHSQQLPRSLQLLMKEWQLIRTTEMTSFVSLDSRIESSQFECECDNTYVHCINSDHYTRCCLLRRNH